MLQIETFNFLNVYKMFSSDGEKNMNRAFIIDQNNVFAIIEHP